MYFSVLPIWMFLGSLTLISWKMQFEAFHWNFHKILNKKQLKYMSVICVFSNPLSFEHSGCNAHSLGTQTTRSGQNTTYIKNYLCIGQNDSWIWKSRPFGTQKAKNPKNFGLLKSCLRNNYGYPMIYPSTHQPSYPLPNYLHIYSIYFWG